MVIYDWLVGHKWHYWRKFRASNTSAACRP